ncbi:MAG: hypothetical protein HY331_17455 [Chloroflexi bacterium]|nr:hypothetical protein [Chloroflexota bacterium]
MKRVLVGLGIFALAFSLVGLAGRSAQAAPGSTRGDHMVVGAGLMAEEDGEAARFAIGAVTVDGVTRGTLKLAVPGQWRYNGNVRELAVNGQTATVKGRGTVRDAAGVHRVTFTVTATAGKPGSIAVEIRGDGFDYAENEPLSRGHIWVE